MEVVVEISKLVWQVVGVRNDIESLLAKPLLHLHHVGAEPVFACQLKTVWKVIDLLEITQIVVDELLVALTAPQQVPIVTLSRHEAIALKRRPHEFGFTLDQLVSEFGYLTQVAAVELSFLVVSTVFVCGRSFFEAFEIDELVFAAHRDIVHLLLRIAHRQHLSLILLNLVLDVCWLHIALNELQLHLLVFELALLEQDVQHCFEPAFLNSLKQAGFIVCLVAVVVPAQVRQCCALVMLC